jgi:hypothetical protein
LIKAELPELRLLGLNGAIGGAEALLKAAMRSLNELLVGFSETGGGPLGLGVEGAGFGGA